MKDSCRNDYIHFTICIHLVFDGKFINGNTSLALFGLLYTSIHLKKIELKKRGVSFTDEINMNI